MTPDTIEQQARREAEERYPDDTDYNDWHCPGEIRREAYAAALIAERSKIRPSVEEVMEVWRKEAELHGTYSPHREERFRDRLTKLFNK